MGRPKQNAESPKLAYATQPLHCEVLHCPSGRTGSSRNTCISLPSSSTPAGTQSKIASDLRETLGYMIKNTCQHNTKTDAVSNSTKGADFRKGPNSIVRGVPRSETCTCVADSSYASGRPTPVCCSAAAKRASVGNSAAHEGRSRICLLPNALSG